MVKLSHPWQLFLGQEDRDESRDTTERGAHRNAHRLGIGTVPASREAARQPRRAQDRTRARRRELQGHDPLRDHGPRAPTRGHVREHRAGRRRGEQHRPRSFLGTSPHEERTLDRIHFKLLQRALFMFRKVAKYVH